MQQAKVAPAVQAKDNAVDLYGDPLPEGAVMRLGTVQLRAAGARLAITDDGKTLVGLRGDRFVTFWDAETGKLKETKELEGVHSFDLLSHDGQLLTNWSPACAAGLSFAKWEGSERIPRQIRIKSDVLEWQPIGSELVDGKRKT